MLEGMTSNKTKCLQLNQTSRHFQVLFGIKLFQKKTVTTIETNQQKFFRPATLLNMPCEKIKTFDLKK